MKKESRGKVYFVLGLGIAPLAMYYNYVFAGMAAGIFLSWGWWYWLRYVILKKQIAKQTAEDK